MVTENVQETRKVQLKYRDNTDVPFSICWTNSAPPNLMNQSNTKKKQKNIPFLQYIWLKWSAFFVHAEEHSIVVVKRLHT